MADESELLEQEARERGQLTRRRLLLAGGAVAVAGGATAVAGCGDEEQKGEDYPRKRIAGTADLQPNKAVSFEYPLKGQSSVVIDLGEEVPGGVGDNNSIVAYSILCQHMGCPIGYEADGKHFLCGCHQSKYDPAREGVVIQGVAQRPLPRVALEIDGNDVFAVGVDGLIYGYRSNLETGNAA